MEYNSSKFCLRQIFCVNKDKAMHCIASKPLVLPTFRDSCSNRCPIPCLVALWLVQIMKTSRALLIFKVSKMSLLP